MRIVAILLAACLLASCSSRWRTTHVPATAFVGESVSIKEWAVLGPYEAPRKSNPWGVDYFASTAGSEKDCTEQQFMESEAPKDSTDAGPNAWFGAQIVKNHEFLDFQRLFGREYSSERPASAVYAACVIESPIQKEAYLLVGSADAEKMWLNGSLIAAEENRHGINTYQEAIHVSLKEGRNFLLVKIVRWSNPDWGLTVRLEPDAQKAAATSLRGQRTLDGILLRRCVITRDQALVLAPRGVPSAARFPAVIRDHQGRVVASCTLGGRTNRWRPGKDTPDGIYELDIECDGDHYKETFCIGEMPELARSCFDKISALHLDDRSAINIEALARRVRILLNAGGDHDQNAERQVQSKFVYTIRALDRALDDLAARREAFKDHTGLHIRGFRSRIDDAVQHYRLYVPEAYQPAGPGIPLVVYLPTQTSASRPFIESVFIAEHAEAERISAIANRLNLAVLWAGYRAQPSGAPCDFAHLDEVLNAVAQDYNIDPHRISLLGSCSGSALGALAVMHWPQRFASFAGLNPAFTLHKPISPETISVFKQYPQFRAWLNAEPLDSFLQCKVPICLVHEAAEPGHGDLESSMALVNRARELSIPLIFHDREGQTAQHLDAWTELFTWIAKQKRDKTSSVSIETPGNDINVASVFSRRFVVVEGTDGTESDRTAIKKLSEDFVSSWKSSHYGPCRTVSDVDFDEEAEANSDLVLLGNSKSNRVWRKHAANAAEVEARGIGVNGQSWEGASLSFVCVVPDSTASSRRLLLIGSNDLPTAHIGTLKLSLDGWFKYAVWSATPGDTQLIAAGR